ncbi:MAG: hypothetical protein RIS94_1388 [Pseudomonadota bacterium]|jgi:hypothetical protein
MAFDHDTPFDRVLMARPATTPDQSGQPLQRGASRKQVRHRWRRHLADSCYLAIKGSTFAASTLAITLGLPLAFFLALSGWHLDVLFTQIDNLASRYLAADPARRAAFSDLLNVAFPGALALIAIWRLPRFVSEVGQGLATGRDDA